MYKATREAKLVADDHDQLEQVILPKVLQYLESTRAELERLRAAMKEMVEKQIADQAKASSDNWT
jgi:hypothetical protein